MRKYVGLEISVWQTCNALWWTHHRGMWCVMARSLAGEQSQQASMKAWGQPTIFSSHQGKKWFWKKGWLRLATRSPFI